MVPTCRQNFSGELYRTDKIIVIADNASFHKAKWFTAWWQSTDWLKIEFLPAYSPDVNPNQHPRSKQRGMLIVSPTQSLTRFDDFGAWAYTSCLDS